MARDMLGAEMAEITLFGPARDEPAERITLGPQDGLEVVVPHQVVHGVRVVEEAEHAALLAGVGDAPHGCALGNLRG